MREIARTRHSYVLCKALTGGLACNDTEIGKTNGSKSRIYLRCAASKPHSTFDSLFGLSKMLMWLCEAERLSEQPKLWVQESKIRITIFENHHIGNDVFLQKSSLGFCKNTRSEIMRVRTAALPRHREFQADTLPHLYRDNSRIR